MPRVVTSETERKVLKVLVKAEHELTGYEIAKRVYGNDSIGLMHKKNFIYKIIKQLAKQGILRVKNSYPTFYALQGTWAQKSKYETILYEVQCPTCKENHWIKDFSLTKQCHCLTAKKQPRRFWITNKRYTGAKKII